MAYTLKTQTISAQTIASDEVQKANKAFSDLEVSQASLASAQQTITEKNARIKQLEDQLAAIPQPPIPVPPTPIPPTPVPTGKTNIYVDGGNLRTKTGKPVVLRSIESMFGPSSAGNPAQFAAVNKTLGANCVGPLPQPSQANVNSLKGLLEETRKAGLICGLNGDHMQGGREKLCDPAIVGLVNQYDHVFIQCEVETGWDQSVAAWKADVIGMINAFRAAGYKKQPIKVGSPDGGRNPTHALQAGKDVVAADPEHNVLFTGQLYWGKDNGGDWTYQSANGYVRGLSGTIKCLQDMAASGLCFIPGLDRQDDVGETGYVELMAECTRLGLGFQYWVLSNGGDPNGLLSSTLNINTITDTGRAVRDEFTRSSVMAELGVR